MTDRADSLRSLIRDVPDFPRPGVVFKDITPLLADPRGFTTVLDLMAEPFAGHGITAILAIESRGFIFGAALAMRMGASFVPARKPGKLPAATDKVTYALEYGTDALEIHKSSFHRGQKVLLVDDVIATGGTAAAAIELATLQGAEVVGATFAIELTFLYGRRRLPPRLDTRAALVY